MKRTSKGHRKSRLSVLFLLFASVFSSAWVSARDSTKASDAAFPEVAAIRLGKDERLLSSNVKSHSFAQTVFSSTSGNSAQDGESIFPDGKIKAQPLRSQKSAISRKLAGLTAEDQASSMKEDEIPRRRLAIRNGTTCEQKVGVLKYNRWTTFVCQFCDSKKWLDVKPPRIKEPTAMMIATQTSVSGAEVTMLMIGLGVLGAALAQVFNILRGKRESGKMNMDTAFDAGGKISMGLTATTIVSQWTWAATLLQSSAVASKYGISGAFWYASGATIQIILFAILSILLKMKAPGAKTFPMVILARFGKAAHVTYLGFALLTSMIVTAMLMLGGAAVITTLVPSLGISDATLLIVGVIGTSTAIGGLGATFYVAYVNTAGIFIIMFVFALKIFHDDSDPNAPLGSSSRLYFLLHCALGPEGNTDSSYLSFFSEGGLIFGIINVVGNFGTVFVDQSYWQSSVAAKPRDGVWGFIAGGLVWFAVPFLFSTTMGLSYLALSTAAGEYLLSEEQVDAGLVPVIVAYSVLGKTGSFLVILIIILAVTSTASAEVIAVTSLLFYDVYQVYIEPFDKTTHIGPGACPLCSGYRSMSEKNDAHRTPCSCTSIENCEQCSADDEIQAKATSPATREPYQCTVHGKFRRYYEKLAKVKNWGILCSTLSIVPLTLLLSFTKVSLGWVYLFMGVLVGSAVIPITLALSWTRVTAYGMIFGAIGGTIVGVSSWLGMAASFPGGLGDFFENTGNQWTMFTGNLTSILFGGLSCVVISLVKPDNKVGRVVVERPEVRPHSAESHGTDEKESSASDDDGYNPRGHKSESAVRSAGSRKVRRSASAAAKKEFAHRENERMRSADSLFADDEDDRELEDDAMKPTPYAWASTRNIDNPLFPWTDFYTRELGILVAGGQLTNADRPALKTIERTFKSVKWTAFIGAIGLSLILILLWPGIQSALSVQDLSGFNTWIAMAEGWAWVVGIFIIVVPVAWEIRTIQADISTTRRSKERTGEDGSSVANRRIPSWRRSGDDETGSVSNVTASFDKRAMDGRPSITTLHTGHGRHDNNGRALELQKLALNEAGGGSILGSILEMRQAEEISGLKEGKMKTEKAPIAWEDQKKRLGF